MPRFPTPAVARPSSRLALAAILLTSLALNVLPVWWGLPSVMGWAPDEVLPPQVVDRDAWWNGYPPFHRYLLVVLYALVDLGVDARGMELHTARFLAGRLLSVLMATGTVYVVYRCGLLLFDRTAARFAALFTATMVPFVYYAKTANLDAPYLFWFALSLLFFLRALSEQRLRDYLLFGLSAALAVCTKDQAYALYLFSPLVLLAALYRRRRATASRGRAVVELMRDPRVFGTALVSSGLFVLIHGIPFDPEPFLRHLRTITGPGSEPFRLFPATFAGQVRMAGLALHHLRFLLGLPLLLFAAVGLAVALRAPRRSWRLLSLAGIALVYYLGFIAVIGYQYDRFFLPVGLVASLLAAPVLARIWELPRPLAAAGRAGLLVVVALSLWRAAAVDVRMHRDPRYDVEDWLRAEAKPKWVLGMGTPRILPRGLGALEWRALGRKACARLERWRPRFVVVNRYDAGQPDVDRVLGPLERGELGYDEAFRHRHEPAHDPLRMEGVFTNLARLDGELVVYRAANRPCVDAESLYGSLDLAAGPDASDLRRSLRSAILHSELPGRRALAQGRARAVGLRPGGWTVGRRPAAIAIRNDGDRSLLPRLGLHCQADPGAFPIAVSVMDGEQERVHAFTEPGIVKVRLGRLAPGEERLWLVGVEKSCRPSAERSPLGVRVIELQLKQARRERGAAAQERL